MTQMNKSGITRRGLLRGATAMGAAALILPAGMRAASAAPKKGGVLRICMGHGSTSDSLDPGTWDNAYSQVFASARHNYLTEIDADGQLVPELATEWSSPDATTWTFKIREGVTFHSGKTLDAGDVIASLNHHRGEDSES
ncbi:MAG: ABC transporter substrate-binding protein, partial [Pseudomonadota bacterium]|nr:ABC transporter substrate-binding protein [Pseudomonadota bacterium]